MNADKVKSMDFKIKQYQNEIKNLIEPCKNYIRVLIIGLADSGKSSLTCCLSKDVLTIKEDGGKQATLAGKGIFSGIKVGSEKPLVYPDHENKLLYCDFPGFDVLRGIEEEMINAFALDYLLNSDEYDIKVKILLVIPYGEFNTRRGKGVLEAIQRLKKMFPDLDIIKTIIGIVITKGDENITGTDHFTTMEARACVELKKWCDYFKIFSDQVFTFPRALKENIGKQYNFIDHQRLTDFLQTKFASNPKYQIPVSNECLNELKDIKSEHFNETANIVKNLFSEIDGEIRKIDQSNSLNFWLNSMNQLLEQNINKANKFYEAFQKFVPDCQKYSKYFRDLESIDILDSFINRICGFDKETSHLRETFQLFTLSAIRELDEQLELAQNEEIGKDKQNNEIQLVNERKTRENIDNAQQFKKDSTEKKKIISDVNEELGNKNAINELEIKNYIFEINQLKKKIEDQENKLLKLENREPQYIMEKSMSACLLC
ncbi:hypothetical protein M9Y10_007140 [Tritrichomonas musculus]|uniref:G domain-containing protein n=1 Tax=Tritrichomonas musculus TaxID=1915356 RepID=A0ABR2J0L0_9EUKA